MDAKIALSPQVEIEIPLRLYEAIRSETMGDSQLAHPEEAVEKGNPFSPSPSGNTADTLSRASELIQQQQPIPGILFLVIYTTKKAQELLVIGKPEDGLGLLADALALELEALRASPPALVSQLTDSLVQTTDQAIHASAMLGSLAVLTARVADVLAVLNVAATIWEPGFEPRIRELEQLAGELGRMGPSNLGRHKDQLSRVLTALKAVIHKLSSRQSRATGQERLNLLLQLANGWLQMVQQEILLAGTVEYSSTGLDLNLVRRQAQQLIGEVETRLRVLIAARYKQQYGPGWVQHIESKHKILYERWLRYRQKDQAAFKSYAQYTPDLLEYALFEDLADLIVAQWQLFRDMFDFGYADRNKTAFYDKMQQIVRVRNVFAHNREAPENEVLRTRVLCTDILLALDRAGEGSAAA